MCGHQYLEQNMKTFLTIAFIVLQVLSKACYSLYLRRTVFFLEVAVFNNYNHSV